MTQRQQHPRNVEADGTGVAARRAERARVRELAPLGQPAQARRDDRADRTGVRVAVGVAADAAIDRTHVLARAAADAAENLRAVAREHAAAAVVDEHDVQLLGTVAVTRFPRTA